MWAASAVPEGRVASVASVVSEGRVASVVSEARAVWVVSVVPEDRVALAVSAVPEGVRDGDCFSNSPLSEEPLGITLLQPAGTHWSAEAG